MAQKFQKIDPKQLPQVIVLGVLTLGVVGYGAMQFMGGGAPPKPAPKKDDKAKPADAALTPAASNDLGNIYLPPAFVADPFRPAIKSQIDLPGMRPNNLRPMPPITPRPLRMTDGGTGLRWPGGALPFPGGIDGGSRTDTPGPAVHITPVQPAPPPRPDVALTGIISAADGKDMALLSLGSDQKVLQVGDAVANDYQVRKIQSDGIWLANARVKDKYFVTLGNKQALGGATGAEPAKTGS